MVRMFDMVTTILTAKFGRWVMRIRQSSLVHVCLFKKYIFSKRVSHACALYGKWFLSLLKKNSYSQFMCIKGLKKGNNKMSVFLMLLNSSR